MSQNPKTILGVSKKLKAIVIFLTVLIFCGFIALFTKFVSKRPLPKKNVLVAPLSNQSLVDEYQVVGKRLIDSGLKEQAIDQYIEIWKMQKMGSKERKSAAQTAGQLYADLDNCQEALVWLFRAEGSDNTVTPLIDACLAKVRSSSPDQ
jgi:hypothetical protein